MLRHCLHLCQLILLSTSSWRNWNSMQNSPTEHPCPSLMSLPCCNSTSRACISCYVVHIMNHFREQSWVPHNPNCLQPAHEGLQSQGNQHISYPKDYEDHMWMILISSRKQNTAPSSWGTSTPWTPTFSSPQKRPDMIDPCPFWTPWSHLNQIEPCPQQCTENQSTHTDQYFHWDSHHSLSSKYSVFNTLTHRARTVLI